ncbi:hypothetical protein LCGC14_2258720, partial [marine sediment metagenome]
MKYIIKRKAKKVVTETREAREACDLGFHFASGYPELVAAGWRVYCTGPQRHDEAGVETYYTGMISGVYHAKDIAERVTNPPRSPHDCPDCKCGPEPRQVYRCPEPG